MTQTLHVEFDQADRSSGPIRFGREGSWCEVDEVVDHWPGQGYEYFKLRSRGAVYILRWDVARDDWQLHFFHDEVAHLDSDSPLIEY